MNLRANDPLDDNIVMCVQNNGQYFGKKMYKDEGKKPYMESKLDLSMPQSPSKLELDARLKKRELRSNRLSVEQKDETKIGNSPMNNGTVADCYFDQRLVDQKVRRFAEPSGGAFIFFR